MARRIGRYVAECEDRTNDGEKELHSDAKQLSQQLVSTPSGPNSQMPLFNVLFFLPICMQADTGLVTLVVQIRFIYWAELPLCLHTGWFLLSQSRLTVCPCIARLAPPFEHNTAPELF